jgi:plastocyanin
MIFFRNLAATALIVSAGCSGTDYGSVSGTTSGGSTIPVQSHAVSVINDFFSPTNVQVAVGTTVTWTWGSGAASHNVTFSDGASSGDKSGGATYSRTFNTAGTYAYHCTIHPGMAGSVLVQ